MKKITLIICALMLLMVACAPEDGDLDNGNDLGEEIQDDIDIDDALDNNNTGANANNDIFDGEEKTLTGSAQGYGGEIIVTVIVDGEDIVSVEATGEDETEGVGSLALDELPDKIAQEDSTDVDSVSGATKTSEGIKQAVNNALQNNNIQSKQ